MAGDARPVEVSEAAAVDGLLAALASGSDLSRLDGMPPAVARFADYLARCERGEDLEFSAFCAEHAELEPALRRLHEHWRQRSEAGGAPVAPRSTAQRYDMLGEVGRGGMGTVLRVFDRDLRRTVAMKVITERRVDPRAMARFIEEAQVTGQLAHPGIVPVHDLGVDDDGRAYYTMPLVDGMSLKAVIELVHGGDAQWPLPRALGVLLRVCEAVAFAHVKGVVHRDLKPSNVMVGGFGEVYVLDWGLAHVLADAPGAVESTRQQLAATTGSPIVTKAGEVLGTPVYMAPEQARGEPIGRPADVYAVGAMLYHLLTRCMPYLDPGTEPTDAAAVVALVRRGPPSPVHVLAPQTPAEISAICERAMARLPQARYASMSELADDLRAYLENRVVKAHRTGAAVELRMWIRRNKGMAAALLAGVLVLGVGAIGTTTQFFRAERRATEAQDKVREFDQLAGVVLHERAIANEAELYPAWPHKVEAMQHWLREDCGKLLAMRDQIERTVRDLRARALPQSESEQQHDRETHPRFAAAQRSEQRLASLRRAHAIRAGAPLVVPDLTTAQQALAPNALNTLAWDRVAPKAKDRKVYGEEAFALACACATVDKAGADQELLDTLAWALFANGQDEQAQQRSAEALAAAPADQKQAYEDQHRDLSDAVANAPKILADAEVEHAALTAELNARQTWTFADEAPRFLHDTLAELLVKLAGLEANEKQQVEQRLAWAQRIEHVSIGAHSAKWDAARAAIAASAKYRGQKIELRDSDVIGLVPIGANAVTELWEFYELRSAWDGKSDPAAIAIPAHRPDGSIEVTGDTGIVFVLLPGGTFTMGAQKEDADRLNFDEQARSNETPHEVTLAPFFLAKYELTQGQWARLRSGDDSLRAPSRYKAGAKNFVGVKITLANPVEQVDWSMCDGLARRHGLVLPTEAQWEYGCRAGTTTPWLCPLDDLVRYANVADASAKRAASEWSAFEDWADQHVVHAPVGSFLPNAFGLHDVHGNVWEWCLDEYGSYSGAVRAGDGLRLQGDGSAHRVNRGGSFYHTAARARSAYRGGNAPSFRDGALGLRPARALGL